MAGQFAHQLATVLGVSVIRLVVAEVGVDRLEWPERVGGVHADGDRALSILTMCGVIDEGVQERSDHQRVFQVVAFLQDAASALLPSPRARYHTFHSSHAM